MLFSIGLLIFLYPHIARYANSIEQEDIIQTFQEEIMQVTETEAKQRIESIEKCNEAIFGNPEAFQDPLVSNQQSKEQSIVTKIMRLTKTYLESSKSQSLKLKNQSILVQLKRI